MRSEENFPQHSLSHRALNATVAIAGLGYLIDMFDLFLFNMVRGESLKDLGLSGNALTDAGLWISNCQMAGLLIGAYASGVISDKYGRKIGLLSSILMYSIGTLASAAVMTAPAYALARFVSGMGLAGELGAGLALISEKMHAARRGYGTMIFISLGFAGVLLAALAAAYLPWRQAYLIGGLAGLTLLCLRLPLQESGLFAKAFQTDAVKGGFKVIVKNPRLLKQYVCGVFLLATAVFVPQICWTLSPELGKAMHLPQPVKAHIVLGIGYGCALMGDMLACLVSERLESRKKASLFFLLAGMAVFGFYMAWPVRGMAAFYAVNGALGLVFGVWVVTVGWIAEHYGTNIRGTVAATAPNFARGLTIPMNLVFGQFKHSNPLLAVSAIGGAVFILAALGWKGLSETYGKDLDYVD